MTVFISRSATAMFLLLWDFKPEAASTFCGAVHSNLPSMSFNQQFADVEPQPASCSLWLARLGNVGKSSKQFCTLCFSNSWSFVENFKASDTVAGASRHVNHSVTGRVSK